MTLNLIHWQQYRLAAANIAVGQGPYLQGYLPMMAMFEHILNGNPMAEGWADPGPGNCNGFKC